MPDNLRYSTDASNRLVLLKGRKRFSLDGKWRLNADHNLEFKLTRSFRQISGDIIAFTGRIISTANDILVFEAVSQDGGGQLHFYLLKLSGLWSVDRYNRITFEVSRRQNPDVLTFSGAWQLNKNQELEYFLQETSLRRGLSRRHAITWKGSWRLKEAGKISYILSGSSKSVLNFRITLDSLRIVSNRESLRFRVGIGVRGKSGFKEKEVSFFGSWKITERMGVEFEMRKPSGKTDRMEFGAKYSFNSRDALTASLVNERNKPLGIRIFLTRSFKF